MPKTKQRDRPFTGQKVPGRMKADLARQKAKREAERPLIRAAKNGDQEAVAELIRLHDKYIWKQAHFWKQFASVPGEDLYQEGVIGLLKALERFNFRRPYLFLTYAAWYIRQACQRAAEYGLSWPLGQFPDGPEFDTAWESQIPDGADGTDAGMSWEEADELFLRAGLHSRERAILKLTLWRGMTYQIAGKLLGISRERVRQIRERAILRVASVFRRERKPA